MQGLPLILRESRTFSYRLRRAERLAAALQHHAPLQPRRRAPRVRPAIEPFYPFAAGGWCGGHRDGFFRQ